MPSQTRSEMHFICLLGRFQSRQDQGEAPHKHDKMVGSVHRKRLKCLALSECYLGVSYDCYCLCKNWDRQNNSFFSSKDDWVFILFSFVVRHVLDAPRCLFIGYDLGNIWEISSSNIPWFVKLHGYSHCFLVCVMLVLVFSHCLDLLGVDWNLSIFLSDRGQMGVCCFSR